jgi:hypothetical protein
MSKFRYNFIIVFVQTPNNMCNVSVLFADESSRESLVFMMQLLDILRHKEAI